MNDINKFIIDNLVIIRKNNLTVTRAEAMNLNQDKTQYITIILQNS